jgi:3-oxoacyl-[acyl-carrier-protein] synthase-3
MNSAITGIGSYVPKKILTNAYFEKIIETNDEWIVKRTGIKERRAVDNESTVEMGKLAANDLEKRYNKDLSDVDFIIFASSTAEHKIPSLASQLQCLLGIKNAGTLDLTAACAGFVYAITMAQSYISIGFSKKILIVASEVLTRHTDYTDRATCILFGDAASAVLVEPSVNSKMYKPVFGTEGEHGHVLYLSDIANHLNSIPIKNNNKVVQDGKKVYKWAVERTSQKFNELLAINGLEVNDIDYFIPHSANQRIIEAICSNVNIDKSKSLQSVSHFGNTSSVTIPLALDLGIIDGKVKNGNKLLLIGFGGGLTYAGVIIDWMIPTS